MELKVRHISKKENETWDQLVNSSPQGHPFLLSEYLSIWAENDPEIHLLRLGCFDKKNNLIGGQAFLHRKKAFRRIEVLLQNWSFTNTPFFTQNIIHGSPQYFLAMQALADEVKRSFDYFRIICHPSIQDVRPLLERGWRAAPDYAHVWDVKKAEELLHELKTKKRFRQIEGIFGSFDFADERHPGIIEEFIPFYQETAQDIGYKLRKSWKNIFRATATKMLKENIIRFYTCRDKNGKLAGAATYVLNPAHHNAYGWQLAHTPFTHSSGEKDFIPALYFFSIEVLSHEVSSIDIAEGLRPSLYFFKDSLGTKSVTEFVVETPNAWFWKMIGNTKKSLFSHH